METGTVTKEYKYVKNGKSFVVKRKYAVKGDRVIKNNELDNYFKDNVDKLSSKKMKLKDIVEDYNNNHDSKVSYSMFYQKYKNVFGFRKNHKNKTENKSEPESVEQENKQESKLSSDNDDWETII